jgi:hypothetical protein
MGNNGIDDMDVIREIKSIEDSILYKYHQNQITSSQVAKRLEALKGYQRDFDTSLENMRNQGK